MTEETKDEKSDVIPRFEEIKPAEHPDGGELNEFIYTNDPSNPMLPRLFHFLYDAVFQNKIGVMHALNKETKKVSTLIVGVEYAEDGSIACLPMAKLLTAEEQELYCAPDGMGGFIGYVPEHEPE